MMIQHPEYEQPRYEKVLEVHSFAPFKLSPKFYFGLQDKVYAQGWHKKRSDVKEYADTFTDIMSCAHPVRRIETFESSTESLLLMFEGKLYFVESCSTKVEEIDRISHVGDARIYMATYIPESMRFSGGLSGRLRKSAFGKQLCDKIHRAREWFVSGILQNIELGSESEHFKNFDIALQNTTKRREERK